MRRIHDSPEVAVETKNETEEVFGRKMDVMKIRYYMDTETGEPHIYNHGVSENEVEEVFESGLGQDRVSREGSRMLMGQTETGRYIRIIYSPDSVGDSVFVITAYELTGKALTAFKRRRRRRS
jgi:hypothetical protein